MFDDDDMFDEVGVDLDAMLGVEPDAPEAQPPPGVRFDPRRNKVVCKHWLRGLCKKGDDCDFLHQLDKDKMPECWFFSNFGECSNKDCIFLHLRPEDKVHECPWFARGFCKHGPRCRNRHTRKKPCTKYLAGFCPDGPDCQFGHPKYELPIMPLPTDRQQHEFGNMPAQAAQARVPRVPFAAGGGGGGGGFNGGGNGFCGGGGGGSSNVGGGPGGTYRDLSTVTCFKCWQTGHYANNCPNPRVEPPAGHPQGQGQQQQQQQQQQPMGQLQPLGQQQQFMQQARSTLGW